MRRCALVLVYVITSGLLLLIPSDVKGQSLCTFVESHGNKVYFIKQSYQIQVYEGVTLISTLNLDPYMGFGNTVYEIEDVAIDPTGNTIAMGLDLVRRTGAIMLVDLRSGTTSVIYVTVGGVKSIVWSPSGTEIALVTIDGTGDGTLTELHVIAANDGTARYEEQVGSLGLGAFDLIWDAASNKIAVSIYNRMHVYDGATLEQVVNISIPDHAIGLLASSNAEGVIASYGTDGYLRIWDMQTLEKVDAISIGLGGLIGVLERSEDDSHWMVNDEYNIFVINSKFEVVHKVRWRAFIYDVEINDGRLVIAGDTVGFIEIASPGVETPGEAGRRGGNHQ